MTCNSQNLFVGVGGGGGAAAIRADICWSFGSHTICFAAGLPHDDNLFRFGIIRHCTTGICATFGKSCSSTKTTSSCQEQLIVMNGICLGMFAAAVSFFGC